jgi:hypothetical protein
MTTGTLNTWVIWEVSLLGVFSGWNIYCISAPRTDFLSPVRGCGKLVEDGGILLPLVFRPLLFVGLHLVLLHGIFANHLGQVVAVHDLLHLGHHRFPGASKVR